jgi:hypothetical protein
MDTDCPTVDPLSARIAYFKRTLARGKIGHRPSLPQRDAILRAARLAAQAEFAAADVSARRADIVALDRRAEAAKASLDRLLDGHRQATAPPILGDLLREGAVPTTEQLVAGYRGQR